MMVHPAGHTPVLFFCFFVVAVAGGMGLKLYDGTPAGATHPPKNCFNPQTAHFYHFSLKIMKSFNYSEEKVNFH
jgi:hypothetical protein